MKKNFMKSRFLVLLVLFFASLLVQEAKTMLRRVPGGVQKSSKRVVRSKFQGFLARTRERRSNKWHQLFSGKREMSRRWYSTDLEKTKMSSLSGKKSGVENGVFTGFFATLKNWWNGNKQAEIAQGMGDIKDFIPTLKQIERSSKMGGENPNLMALAFLGFTKYSSVAQNISNSIYKGLSLETKQKLARYLAYTVLGNHNEYLIGATSVRSLTLLPLLLMIQQKTKQVEDAAIFDLVPVDVLPASEFSPFLHTGRTNSPIMEASRQSSEIDREQFKTMVSDPISKMMNIKKPGFDDALWSLINTKYKDLEGQNELLVVRDRYVNKDIPEYNYVSYDDYQTTVLTFGNKELNQLWGDIDIDIKIHKDTEILREFINPRYRGVPQLRVSESRFGEESEIEIDTHAAIKEGSIYENKELLNDVMNLVEAYSK
jgi:hypothetical protein